MIHTGLSSQEAKHRLHLYGENVLQKPLEKSYFKVFIGLLTTPISLLLILAAIFSAIFGDSVESLIILAMVVISAVLDFYQEYRSSEAVKLLAKKVTRKSTVIRGGQKQEVLASEIVIGDLVFLSIGDIIPADSKIIEVETLCVNESILTGESFVVEKNLQDIVYSGTSIATGWAVVEVLATGVDTKLGEISKQLAVDNGLKAFEVGTRNYSKLIFKVTLIIVSVVLAINLTKDYLSGGFSREAVFQAVLFSITIAVGLAPELLPVIMSINKAKGSYKMGKVGVLVKKLDSIPDFGSMNILCSDKTGTLTENKITLVKHLDLSGEESEKVLKLAYLNSYYQTGYKSSLDQAILDFEMEDVGGFTKVDELPYDFDRKRLSVVVSEGGRSVLSCKGQPEEMLKICTQVDIAGQLKSIGVEEIQKFNQMYSELSKQGYRVLAVARKTVLRNKAFTYQDESNLTLVGLLAFLDPPKLSTAKALASLQDKGVEIKIITGDNELVSRKICQDMGLEVSEVLTGNRVENLSDAEFNQAIKRVNLFARFNPEQKQRVIQALKSQGNVVGYIGDGINDSPSLKTADVGISVDNAVDVARESADIILLNKNLNILLQGVIEGRKIFGNSIKYMLMAVSSNFGNMLSLIGAAIFLPFLPMLPVQVLLNNILYDISQIFIPTDNVDEEFTNRPQRWNIDFIKEFMLVFGLVSSAFDMATFYILYEIFGLTEKSFQTAWFLESIATQVLVIYIIRTRLVPILQSRPSKWLVINSIAVLGVAFSLPFTPIGAGFNLVVLPAQVLISIGGIVLAYLAITEFTKQIFYKFYR